MTYPAWAWFPRQHAPEPWVGPLAEVFTSHHQEINSADRKGLTSDGLLEVVRPALVSLGWQVEAGKQSTQKIRRPVLFGDNGAVKVNQEIDAWHPDLKIIMELESGRAIMGNAVYRDLVRASLVADADYLVIGVRQFYEYGKSSVNRNDFTSTRDLLESIYASGRLHLPFKGILILGW
jgi:hypothetical protein